MAGEETGRRRPRRWPVPLALVLAALLLLIAIAWIQRRPLAERFVARELAARGVAGRYRIEAIGPFEQRLADVSIGDPARPDLTARSVVLRLGWSPAGPHVAGIVARHVRLRARVADGRLSLGAVDGLLPAPSGAPLALPAIDAEVEDMGVVLDTPAGAMALTLAGAGRLDGGFRGTLGIAAPALTAAGCRIGDARGTLAVSVTRAAPGFAGPLSAAAVACGAGRIVRPRLRLDARLRPTLDGWSGTAALAATGVTAADARLGQTAGMLRFAGVPARTEGQVTLAAPLAAAGLVAPRAAADLRFAIGQGVEAAGTVRMAQARYPLAPRLAALDAAAGSPLAPLAAALRASLVAASRDFDAAAEIRYDGAFTAWRLSLNSASGVAATFNGALGATPTGTLTAGGGGLPAIRVTLGPDTATVIVAPLAAGGARLVLAPIRVTRRDRITHITTRALLDGPVAGGRVTGLAVPVDLRLGAAGTALASPCLPLRLARLEIAGFDFRDAAATACMAGDSVRVARLALAGRSGDAPATLALTGFRYAAGRFAMGDVAASIGPPDRRSRLDLATLDGRVGPDGLAGHFSGARGSIAAVPILASEGAGSWTLAGGRLAITGALRVADVAAEPRFAPLVSDDVRLALADGRIDATATLAEPAGRTAVTRVTIRHDLSAGSGDAVLAVPGVTFDDALQPDRLTRLTLGVVANVRGTVTGEGRIRWTPAGVTSDGDFATDGIDLAAAFGPVSGIRGRIHFDDLLALATPPGQQATIAEANPGIAVTDGVVRYQLLPDQRVRIEGGRWPFAGGALLLQPATVDLGRDTDRRLTFAVDGLDAARFVQQLGFENIAATGTFDGTVPMVFGASGGRIEGGRLVARDGGGTLAYVGELTQAQLGTFGKLAFDALKSIRYRNLTILLDGALDGEIVSRVGFAGVNQEPLAGSETPFRRQLKGLPFVFNITVRAPFRGLLGSARAFADPTAFIRERIAAQPLPGDPAAPAVQGADSVPKP